MHTARRNNCKYCIHYRDPQTLPALLSVHQSSYQYVHIASTLCSWLACVVFVVWPLFVLAVCPATPLHQISHGVVTIGWVDADGFVWLCDICNIVRLCVYGAIVQHSSSHCKNMARFVCCCVSLGGQLFWHQTPSEMAWRVTGSGRVWCLRVMFGVV